MAVGCGVNVTVGVKAVVGVDVAAGTKVAVDVGMGTGVEVSVHAAAVSAACSSGESDGPQAEMASRTGNNMKNTLLI